MKIKSFYLLFTSLILGIYFIGSAETVKEVMRNYCAVPPFMETSLKPNIIIIQDFSSSMQYPAYYPYKYRRYYAINKVVIANGKKAYSVTYNPNKNYYGYFKSNSYYKYNSFYGYWEENTSSSCQSVRDDEELKAIGNGDDCISGNLLNFFVMSRIDVSLRALTGGKVRDCFGSKCLLPRGSYRKVYDKNLHCLIKIYPNKYWDNQNEYNSSDFDMKISVSNYKGTCKIGTFSGRWLRIKIDPEDHLGVLQKNADIANYALMVFSGDDRYGEIRYGIHEYRKYGMEPLLTKLESELPWRGTPQNAALSEALDYISQVNYNSTYPYYENNWGYINRGSEVDPFYSEEFQKLVPCINNVIILISDGGWNISGDPLPTAWKLHTKDLRPDLRGQQSAQIFTLYTFSTSTSARNAMKSVAAAGSFNDLDGDNEPFEIDINSNSFEISFPRPKCNPNGTYEDLCKEWDGNMDGDPDSYFTASDGEAIEKAMTNILSAIAKYNYSGSSVGILGKRSKEHSASGVILAGTVLAQPLYYSQKYGINWLGKVYGYWYYLKDASIREDTDNNSILNYSIDKIIEFGLENEKDLVLYRYNIYSDGSKKNLDAKFYDPDDVNYLYELGYDLWANYNESNDDDSDDRNIYFAACEKGEDCLKEFKYTALSDFIFERSYEGNIFKLPLLGMPAECFNMCNYFDNMFSFNPFSIWQEFIDCISRNNDYEKLINYIRGRDYVGFRTRTIEGKVWKLGDIIYSSPQVVTYPNGESYLFVGANDGMLHAFKIGKLERNTDGSNVVQLRENDIKKEVWAFIPLNLLPYLRFLADPDYCHLYYVDLTPTVMQTKEGKIILIGGLRLGAATGSTGDGSVNPPGWACPASFWDFIRQSCYTCSDYMFGFSFICNFIPKSAPNYSACLGLSSYFALDITDPKNPKFLWEFTHPDLGFTYSGPTFIYKEGKTYVMFGSGPVNYNGDSNQELKYFVIDLYGENLKRPVIIETGKENAFSGRMNPRGLDFDEDGYTDYVIVGYSKKGWNMSDWKGGLVFIDTRNDDPHFWKYDIHFEDLLGPVTSRVDFGKCYNKLFIYFGSGRWFYKLDNPRPTRAERIYGVPLKCNAKDGCKPILTLSNNPKYVCSEAENDNLRGWYRDLELGNETYLKERVITDPVLTDQNVVLFTTIEPTSDVCGFGGRTRIWALNCATGGSLLQNCQSYPIDVDKISGTILLQLSGGNIEQYSLRDIPYQTVIGETTQWTIGTAPEGGPGFIKQMALKGEILLWLER
jgi:type IV pilus assembly protein PilY1